MKGTRQGARVAGEGVWGAFEMQLGKWAARVQEMVTANTSSRLGVGDNVRRGPEGL